MNAWEKAGSVKFCGSLASCSITMEKVPICNMAVTIQSIDMYLQRLYVCMYYVATSKHVATFEVSHFSMC